jgi:hypothetical protein
VDIDVRHVVGTYAKSGTICLFVPFFGMVDTPILVLLYFFRPGADLTNAAVSPGNFCRPDADLTNAAVCG